ncbi:MAG: carbohydrate-binding domain-containing protein [Candidatus Cohnella colombiensis]|uniref:cellulase n=1 Tax=Candidatus Cohnella colombiensis TaxID=3121368 RepID=A0AA95JCC9_9BACL|nr:MAG: carbohydrate-binding domain-containing protein [Cohnella sp.]
MRKMKTRILAIFMVIALISSLIPTFAGAAPEALGSSLLADAAVKPSVGGALQLVTDEDTGSTTLSDQNGDPIQLRGMSTHGLQWFPGIINDNAFKALANDWDSNVIRLAMYVGEGGYATDSSVKQKVIDGINLAIANDMYVIVDWHVHAPGDPNAGVYAGALDFFEEISDLYPNNPNIIYELANEPNSGAPGVKNDADGWAAVKSYAEPIIEMLRDNGNDNIVIVGSPNWSQRPDLVVANPINDANTMYTVHFYTGTHMPDDASVRDNTNVMNNARYAIEHGLAVFATEWGTSEASGNNGPFLDEADVWLEFLNSNNISWANWSLTNKAETSAAFTALELGKTEATDLNPGNDHVWSPKELSVSGEYVRARIKGIEYEPIDRTKEEFSINVWDFNDGTTQGFGQNSGNWLTLANVNKALQISGLTSSNSEWDNRISADSSTARPDILGADTITIDVITSAPTAVSIAAIPQSSSHSWTNPTSTAQVTAGDFVSVSSGVYKATIKLTGGSAANLANIANDPKDHILTNIIFLIASPDASVISLDNITFSGVRTIVTQPVVHAPLGTATFPSDFDDSTRQGWNWAGESGIKGALTIEEANGSKAISWEIMYPDVKPSDNWASAPRLVLEKSNLKRGSNKYVDFDFYIDPTRASAGALDINLVFGAKDFGYWAQHPVSVRIPLSTLNAQQKTTDGLYHYKVSYDIDKMTGITATTDLGKVIIVVADVESDFAGRMYVDNVTFANHTDPDPGTDPGTTDPEIHLIGNDNVKKPSVGGALQLVTDEDTGSTTLSDQNGDPIQLRGMSTHGLQWFPEILNDNAFKALANDWDSNVIRLAMYVGETGYATKPEVMKARVIEGIELAIANDMYVIVDWHVHAPGDPNAGVYAGALDFFEEISDLYPNNPNIIYELANEPNSGAPGVKNDADGWAAVKSYAEPIIEMLRDNGNDNIVIVGSPNWSQRPDLAVANPINDANTMYTVHFYTGTHMPDDASVRDNTNVMNNARYAIEHGLAVFATEWGTSEASGNNGPFLDEADVWLEFLNSNNISWANWSLTNKAETSAAFTALELGKTEATDLNPGNDHVWSPKELSVSGEYVRARIKGIEYEPIDRTKEEFSINVWDFNDGTTQGFGQNSGNWLTLANVNKALQISGLTSSNSEWDNRISADSSTARPDILGADTITIDVITSAPTAVSIAAIPQSSSHSWTNPTSVAQVTVDDFVSVSSGVYKATIKLTGGSAANLANIANDPNDHILTNIIFLIASPDASVISLDNITFSGVRTIVTQPVVHAPLGTATFPSDFEDSTRQGWNWAGESGIKGALTIEEANGSKAISWEIMYPDVKPSDNWASAPRLVLEKSNLQRGSNKFVDFDFYIDPTRASAGALDINLVFGAKDFGYWAQHPVSVRIPLSTLNAQQKTTDGLYHYKVSYDIDKMTGITATTDLGKVIIVVADVESDFAGRMYVDNVTFANDKPSEPPSNPGSGSYDFLANVGTKDLPKADRNGKISVSLDKGATKATFSANGANISDNDYIELNNQDVIMQIPASVYKQLQQLLSSDELKDATIAVQMAPISSSDQTILMDRAAAHTTATVTAAGEIWNFSISIVSKAGKEIKLTQFNDPITIALNINKGVNPELLGVYYVSDEGSLEYAGGKLEGDKLVAKVGHFSMYGVLSYDKSFADVSDTHWAAKAIKQMAAKHIIEGISETNFAPEGLVTRAEFAALIVRALGIKSNGKSHFSDVASSAWYASAVEAASEVGIVKGRSASTFDPKAPISREEMAVMLVRAYKYKSGKDAPTIAELKFDDQAAISAWALDAVTSAYSLGFIKGRNNNQFVPQSYATRAESAQVISRLLVD